MANRLGKPDPGTSRKLTTTECEVASLHVRLGWVAEVASTGRTTLIAAPGLSWGPDSRWVRDLEAHWEARRVVPKRSESEDARGDYTMREVVRYEAHPRNKLRRVEVLACGHRLFMLCRDPKRKRRHCKQCAANAEMSEAS